MDKVTDRILWSVLILAIGVSLFVFFKPVAAKIVHNSFDHIENIKNKDDTSLTDVIYFGASGVISSPKAGVYDFNTYAVPLSQDLQRQWNHGDGIGFEPLTHEKGYLYDFSYDIVLLKGQIVTLGGHNAQRDADSKLLVNGQELPLISGGDIDTFCASVNAPNGLVVGQKYHVDEIFRVNNTDCDNTAVYIQPNRRESTNHDFQAEVSNVKFDKYVVK